MAWQLIPQCEWLDTEQQVVEAAQYLHNNPDRRFSFDTETTGLHPTRAYPLLLSLSDGRRRFACKAEWLQHPWIKDGLFQNPELTNVATNIKFDMHMLANVGVQVLGPLECTVVMDWLFDENRYEHGLKGTAREHCGIKMKGFTDVFPMRKKKKGQPDDTPGDAIQRVMADPEGWARAVEYAGLDAFATMKVRDYLVDRLKEDNVGEGYSYWDYFNGWERDFTRVLWNMERRGMSIATGHLKSQIGPITSDMEGILGQIAQMAGHPVNPNSPKQLQKLFFEELKYEPVKMTKGGASGIKKPSTDVEVLNKFIEDRHCPYSKLIIDYRDLSKTRGTYIVGPLSLVDRRTLRLHSNLKQHGTVTGRLSSADPNLQNLPRAKGDKYGIRSAFVAPPGKILAVADYAQLEMRLMAHFSGDERMIKAILDGLDLHCYTVSLMYGVDYDEVFAAKKWKGDPTDRMILLLDYRQAAKATGFGLIYGIGAPGLAVQLSAALGRTVDKAEAQEMIRGYFNVFQGVHAFIKFVHSDCKKAEFVRTILGRKRRLPQINAPRGKRGQDDEFGGTAAQAQRQSVNSIIQGTAADVAKSSMLKCEFDQELGTLGAEMLMQIHDELIFEIDDQPQIIDLAMKRIIDIMEDPFPGFPLSVPLPVEAEVGYTWADAK